ncbi:hypothetical protein E2320_009153 [Naja naja]|nr:hypothetical protein E2320_009153 [Naja naja]
MKLTAELSNKSMVEVHGASSPVSEKKTLAVHQEEATEKDVDLPGDDDIHRLKTASGCGGNHPRAACRFRTANCQRCGKRGHLARKCRAILPDDRVQAKQGQIKRTPRKVPRLGEECFTIQRDNWHFNPRGQDCQMEVDTGSSLSLVTWSTIKRLVPKMAKKRLRPRSLTLRDYQGNKIPILGLTKVTVVFKQFKGRFPLIVVERALPSLLGLDWHKTRIDCPLQSIK